MEKITIIEEKITEKEKREPFEIWLDGWYEDDDGETWKVLEKLNTLEDTYKILREEGLKIKKMELIENRILIRTDKPSFIEIEIL